MVTDASTLKFHGRDEFRRELVAGKVIKLLISDIDASPLVIDGDWGTGKTEFCPKLINKSRESHEGYRLLYVDV
jgi:predicted KAP-like P-loop ATPase